jgi:hemerythrin-like domain-containing protein
MDIINEIVRDHRRLRELIDRVRAENISISSRKLAFRELVPLVKAHASAEEKSLYDFARRKKKLLKMFALVGFEEHHAALEMSDKARKTNTSDHWLARATVFCEMLEHHLDQEEDDFFPELRKELHERASTELANRYRSLMPPAETKRSERRIGRKPFLRPVAAPLEAFIPPIP